MYCVLQQVQAIHPLYSTSGMGVGSDLVVANGEISTNGEEDDHMEGLLQIEMMQKCQVHKMLIRKLRAKLIPLFDILFWQYAT